MDFCVFAKIAWPLVTHEARQGEKVRALLASGTHFKPGEDDIVAEANEDTLSRYYAVPGRINEFAEKLIPYLDTGSFAEAADNASPDAKRNAAAMLKKEFPDVEPGNVAERSAEIFSAIMHEAGGQPLEIAAQSALPFRVDHTQDDQVAYLLEECGWRCPVCNKRLVKRSKDTALRRYRLVKIVPTSMRALATETKPSNGSGIPEPDSLENMALLCPDDADDYEISPRVEKCRELLRKKTEMRARYKLLSSIDDLEIEDAIGDLLDSINELAIASKDMPSRMDPTDAMNKISENNVLLRQTIERHVTDYFYLMRSSLDQMAGSKSLNFRKLSSNMRLCYEEFAERGYDQDRTFGMMASWVSEHTGCENLIACEVFVSFFVQLCEVFDEIAK